MIIKIRKLFINLSEIFNQKKYLDMKKIALFIIATFVVSFSYGQNKSDKMIFKQYEPGFYQNVILKDVRHVNKTKAPSKVKSYPEMDQSGMDLPNKLTDYEPLWHNPPISQGNAGTCWSYATISLFESDIKRMYDLEVKLSETYVDYWEYVEKAEEFVRTRGVSIFEQGSEGNATNKVMKKYGIVPLSAYSGLIDGRIYHSHAQMFAEMTSYLNSVKDRNEWNEELVVSTIKSIMNTHIGVPPTEFKVGTKTYTPMTYMTDYLKFNPDDYVDLISLKQAPYWTTIEYPVPDNYWHDDSYHNVPLDVYMTTIDKVLDNGYTISIGGDVSEAGFSRLTQCAIIPTFDIPTEYINEDSRQMRFSNNSTTDDHGMHIVAYINYKGQKWYLVKDSSSGSRNNDASAPEFGYYFFTADYIKLKIMDFMVHKDAIKDILKKF